MVHASDLGFVALIIGMAAAAYGVFASAVGQRMGIRELVVSGRNAVWVVTACLLTAAAVLVYSFWVLDFGVEFVARNASLAQPRYYTISAFYGGQEGSLLLWATGLAVFSGAAMWVNRRRYPDILPYTAAVLMFIQLFFLVMLVFLSNPFERLNFPPSDGQGLNPLLRHPGMMMHPPFLLTGFMSWSIPFAFGMGALISGRLDNQWLKAVRPWLLLAWAIQGTGLLLGAWWAYHVLGWGGYWGWDPVENVAFMPWLLGTALLHSIVVQERRGMLKKWNMLLIIIAFNLAIFGTLVVRGGLLSSVHNFASSALGPSFLSFLAIMATVSLIFFFKQSLKLQSDQRFDSATSKESSFLFNNLMLGGVAFATFWGTIFPLLTEAFNGTKITVGPPFFDKVNGPIMLGLLVFMGIGPLLAWRRTSWLSIRRNFRFPLGLALVWAIVMITVLRITNPWTILGVSISTFTFGAVVLKYYRGVRTRRQVTGESYPAALGGLVARNRRRYGGYIVHVAILVFSVGAIGSHLHQVQDQVTLHPNESAQVGTYTLTYRDIQRTATADSTIDRAFLEVSRGGKVVSMMTPRVETYRNFDNQPASHVAIRSTPIEDIYVFLAAYDGEVATFTVFINPLVLWLWVGGGIFLFGTVVAFWPMTQREPAYATRPTSGAVARA